MKPQRRDLLWPVAAASCSFALLFVFWLLAVHGKYFPWGDEFSLLVNSTKYFAPHPGAWFLQGFSRYFGPYPEWFQGGSDFIRPVVNLVYYLSSVVFGTHWDRYLLVNYAAHSLVVGAATYLAHRSLKLGGWAVLCVAALTFLSPAVENHVLYLPSFAFDSLDALLVLVVCILTMERRYLTACMVALLASFTKEMSWFAPIAVAVCLLLTERSRTVRWRAMAAASFVAVLLPCLALRTYVFRGHLGAYTLSSLTSVRAVAMSTARGLAKWPAMPLTRAEAGLGTQWRPDVGPHSAYAYALLAAGMVVSLLFWVVFATSLGQTLAQRRRLVSEESRARIVLTVFLAGSLVLLVVGCLAVRFGAIAYPLIFVFLLDRLQWPATGKWGRVSTVVVLVFVGLCSVMQKAEMLGRERRDQELLWVASRSYVAALGSVQEPVVVTLDDLSGGTSSPEYVQRFAGYRGVLVRGSDLEMDARCVKPLKLAASCNSAGECAVQSHIDPVCGELQLRNVDPRVIAGDGSLVRHGAAELRYGFGEMVPGLIETQDLAVSISGQAGRFVVLLPDARGGYSVLRPAKRALALSGAAR